MQFKKIGIYLFLLMVLTSCLTLGNNKSNKSDWTFDNYLLEVQKNTSRQRYSTAINNLLEIQKKFPDTEAVMVNYLIAYNYFSIKAYSTARKYFDNVFSIYQTLTKEGEIIENEKFIILAKSLIAKIDETEAYFDPYHVREERESAGKKITPKKE
ncbi:MAG: hypothetical protein A2015_12460 [Spirochaetes bacterium GWF1_31_7]|nr:MAG: hypothetical protein A2Y30_09405 [Spirochaetes bacterium GWE1_32_154]OHD48986.1 MAG: hypothetical protein A2Y29_17085 [Spirochaetes bacterium GWE2_31_10]OHD49574.1 MAG: hypothetical protein A2015_12460 [Spirochaetes bacterium GWF1_31_7]OHD80479.1 MAG: hypothetical protein A2355_12060 [Spirochaetes bacterium RIFOXYB1_FULL_32_8]HBD95918.1 hypothetical protein [Spirochaetia bacterium]